VRPGRTAALCAAAALAMAAAGCGGSGSSRPPTAPSTARTPPPPTGTVALPSPGRARAAVPRQYRAILADTRTALYATGLGLIGGSSDPAALAARGRALDLVQQRLGRALAVVDRARFADPAQEALRRAVVAAGDVATVRLAEFVGALREGDLQVVRSTGGRARIALSTLSRTLTGG